MTDLAARCTCETNCHMDCDGCGCTFHSARPPDQPTLAALLEDALDAVGVQLGVKSRYATAAARLEAAGVRVAAPRSEDAARRIACPDCGDEGWYVTADPNEHGEPGEPYQVLCPNALFHERSDDAAPLRDAAQAVVDAWVDDESGMGPFDPELIDRLADALAR